MTGSWGASFQDVDTPMAKGTDGVWTATVGPLDPELYTYRFEVDGEELADPEAAQRVADPADPERTVLVPGAAADYVTSDGPNGTVTPLTYHSAVAGRERPLWVWTPPDYDPERTHPTLYLPGGPSRFNTARVDVMFSRMIRSGAMPPTIVVVRENETTGRSYHPIGEDLFPQDLRESIVPAVEAAYPVSREARDRALAGFSASGVATMDTFLTQRGLVGWFGSFSGGYNVNTFDPARFPGFDPVADLQANGAPLLTAAAAAGDAELLMVGTGLDDIGLNGTTRTIAMLTAAHIPVTTVFRPGAAHNDENTRELLRLFAERVFD
ncbi:alpha/beta hydrolase [Pseudonocardia pini]|uniref:alpha/beta hydrolase n=1 Tax=Pseudonocardia pini TaxID=2758030 RepID=UPI0015F05CC4|nr:alpha/beta hydrolase-fold protein [Pseudonocardia pini]